MTKTTTSSQDPYQVEPWWQRILNSDLFYDFSRRPVVVLSAVMTLLIISASMLAPWIAPHTPFDPASLNLMDGFTPPMEPNAFTGNVYWLGTDSQGRDIFSAILYGARVSLLVGFAAVGFAAILGITLGLIAGYKGGWIDTVIMRIADVQLSFPAILIALLIFGITKSLIPRELQEQAAVYVLILSIGLSDWVQYARTVRSSTLAEKNKEYVQAARLFGVTWPRILLRHILPNVMGPVLVIGTIGLALAIILESTLSFLGVGVPATQPSLGTLIRVGNEYLFSGEWWITIFPGLTLLVLALSVNLLGDWLRDALNPRLR
ncbi:peptide/nickel transport system permease protein [Marinospirillum celere]|uniref:Peptide/nickel transport system permease protein n=1 Tax=Marinospirillum celere TaxID=1122252 RepID=A0A1I1GD37_9GAMM|nr:ABC transporter permease [Marinospirillum celere]SFC07243.1 peptide/nickel transport system permease protein [Marinospirillum celere]